LVFIHASRSTKRAPAQWLAETFKLKVPIDVPLGAIVAIADLTDVVTRKNAKRFGRWFVGPYGFVLSNVRALQFPVKTLGKLGLYRPSVSLRRRVEAEIRHIGVRR